MKKIILLALLLLSSLNAQLSPGELADVHAKYEGIENCNKCHSTELGIDSDKCLNCHEPLSERIAADKGLHANPEYRKCESCHVDHLGRDNKLIWWKNGIKKFNHNLTGYVLEGAHSRIGCEKCHKQENISDKNYLKKFNKDLDKTYLGLTAKCLGCHEDEHKGQVSSKCQSCHTMEGWKPAPNFDHDKARFKLTGAHIRVSCDQCHRPKSVSEGQKFKFTGIRFGQCIDCHLDPHENRFGSSCSNCHLTVSWHTRTGDQFNHDLTAYPLQGAHRALKCSSCHPSGRPMKPLAHKQCIDCHKDYHQRQFLADNRVIDCIHCHTLNGFSPSSYTVEQHQLTEFQLMGAHLATPCFLCHTPTYKKRSNKTTLKFTFYDLRCISCHENIHGTISQDYMQGDDCTSCHSEESWEMIDFDHSKTKFPLTGKHEVIKCSRCHQKSSVKISIKLVLTGLESSCISCHDDKHAGQFAINDQIDCGRCHVTKDWLAEKFDHDRDSRFAIKGGHLNVPCASCHKAETVNGNTIIRYKPLRYDCAACHDLREEKKS